MSKHTPGPWTVWQGGVFENEGMYGIKEQGDSALEQEANAHLIAAAPDLLAFLKKWKSFNIDGSEPEQNEYDAELAAILARAEGK